MNSIGNSSNALDLIGLQELKSKSKMDPGNKEALHKAAQHFESIFIGMMLKSMRQANAVFEEGNPMHSNTTKFFRDMYDSQLATDMSEQGSMGLADIIVDQLSGDNDKYVNAGVLRNDNRFDELVGNISKNQNTLEQTTPNQNAGFTLPGDDQHIKERLFAGAEAAINANTTKQEKSPVIAKKPSISFDSPEEFVDSVWEYAKQNASKIGVNPAVMIAQSALETGWGKHVIKDKEGNSSFNLFNVKAHRDWDGSKTAQSTLEFENGVAVKKVEPFRVYNNLNESFGDFVHFLKSNNRYQPALEQSDNPEQFLQGLQDAGYATDPNYANKILGILNSDKFQEMIGKFSELSDGE
ncbi:flagellar assembly peptidoglycan hydrolase FlgJ [Psychrosphaera sp.]|nr:flagellar assembly peptidoglycan hydrolase FlgJ [Psychrosphaera sp.]